MGAVVLLTNNGAFCSGALIDEEGTVLTAYHCVASEGRRLYRLVQDNYRAQTVAVDVQHDLALIQIEDWSVNDYTPLIVQPKNPKQGELVYALGHHWLLTHGNPCSKERCNGLSQGIVSAVGERLIQAEFTNFGIQAKINRQYIR